MRNSGMGTNSFFGAISLFVSIFPFVHTVEIAHSLYVFTLCFLGKGEVSKADQSCLKLSKAARSCPEYSGHFSTFSALDSFGATFFNFAHVWALHPKKHKVRAISTVCTNGKMETKREMAPKNELVPMPEFRIQVLIFINSHKN